MCSVMCHDHRRICVYFIHLKTLTGDDISTVTSTVVRNKKKIWERNSDPRGAIVPNVICWKARLYGIFMGIISESGLRRLYYSNNRNGQRIASYWQ